MNEYAAPIMKVADLARPALARALVEDHLYGCDQNTCDIRMAAELGLPYCAAKMLLDATEAPVTQAVLAGVPGWEREEATEFAIFASWFQGNTVECPNCASFVQFELSSHARTELTCANCLTVFTPRKRS